MRFTATAALSTVLLAPLALAQSSESAAASASASASSNSSDSNFLTTVLGALTAANLTSLVGVASAIANTTEGMALLGQLAVGNKTVFAPNNEAFSGVSSDVTGNTTLLTEILSYHILNNTYSSSGIATAPSHTIARTLLRGGIYQLPGNRTAPLVLEKSNSSSSSNSSSNSTSFEIVQAAKITPQGPVSALNLQVYIIDQVLDLPGNISAIASAAAPQLAGLVQQTGLLEPLENAVGITVFAPSDTAIAAAQSALGQVTNATLVQNVLLNHVINGSVVYSTELASSNYTSAAGEKFTFSTNATGAYVTSGNSTAQIIASDIIINNGVVHLIDGVLLNLGSNSTAASDAYSSGTAAAATQTQPTGAITATSQPAASGSGGGASGAASSGSAGRIQPLGLTNSMLGGALALCASVIGGAFVLF